MASSKTSKTREPKGPAHGPSARSVAAEVLVRVERDGAFATAALEAELSRAVQLDPRDRALATELAYGALRSMATLDAAIGRHAPKGTRGLDPRTRAELRLAAYQLLYLSRVPAFAAVNEAVSAVRARKGDRVSAFVNAVLRRVSEDAKAARDLAPTEKPDPPPWMMEALTRALGEEGAAQFVACGAPAVSLRVEGDRSREEMIAKLAAAVPQASVEAGKLSPFAILLRGAGKPQSLPGYGAGEFSIQEEGSQIVALAVGALPGERVLDACAGRGNKTAVLARAVTTSGAVDAADVHPGKLERLEAELGRIGLRARGAFAIDFSVGGGEIEDASSLYDRVLVDAPCSGIGTMRRRPELALRREATDLKELAALQLVIAKNASLRVRPGGRFLYAVCSVLVEEAEEVVAALLRERPELTPAPFDAEIARKIAGDSSSFRLVPHEHGTDGYFVASFTKS